MDIFLNGTAYTTPANAYLFIYLFIFTSLELSTREGSKLFRCDTHNEANVRRKTVKWPWKITCGICSRNVQVRYDANFKGRISSFERRKYFTILKTQPA